MSKKPTRKKKVIRCKLSAIVAEENLRRAQAAKGKPYDVVNVHTLSKSIGMPYNTIKRLYENSSKRFDEDTVLRICGHFGFTKLDDLFEIVEVEAA